MSVKRVDHRKHIKKYQKRIPYEDFDTNPLPIDPLWMGQAKKLEENGKRIHRPNLDEYEGD